MTKIADIATVSLHREYGMYPNSEFNVVCLEVGGKQFGMSLEIDMNDRAVELAVRTAMSKIMETLPDAIKAAISQESKDARPAPAG